VRRWRRRALALCFGLLLGASTVEVAVRLLWSRLVRSDDAPLLTGELLGPALYAESVGTYVDGVSTSGAPRGEMPRANACRRHA
jgi:hypothetical protein